MLTEQNTGEDMEKLSIRGNHPEHHEYDKNSAIADNVLDTLQLVDTPTEEAFDKHTRLVSAFLDVPVALVSFVEENKDRQYFKSEIGLSGVWKKSRQTPLTHSFCKHVKWENQTLIVEDAHKDARVCDNLAVPDLGVRAYLGAPIHGPADEPLGALCAIDSKERVWSPREVKGIVDLAACVTDQIRLRAALLRKHGISGLKPNSRGIYSPRTA